MSSDSNLDYGAHEMDEAVLGSYRETALVEQFVNISRKTYDHLATDPLYASRTFKNITDESGCRVELVNCENQRPSTTTQFQPKFGHQQKTRREYFLKVTGSLCDTEIAKVAIARMLKNKDSEERVSLKMDVSFSDHSFIIGRYGRGIQTVMRETDCHIHFPDSNRNHEFEKSNQVSITGAPQGVAEARRRIRHLLPISFAFLIRDVYYLEAIETNDNEAYVRPHYKQFHERLQNEYNITIMVSPMQEILTAIVTVRGRHGNIRRIRQGIDRLMQNLLPGCSSVGTYLGIEVSPHHLEFVRGHKNRNIAELARETRTEFAFLEQRKSRHQIPTVRISGLVGNVYEAWVKFMDLLPLALVVDIPASAITGLSQTQHSDLSEFSCGSLESFPRLGRQEGSPMLLGSYNMDDVAVRLNELLNDYDISLTTRQKNREVSQWLLVIKGPEKNVDLMFEIYEALKKNDPVSQVLARLRQRSTSLPRKENTVLSSTGNSPVIFQQSPAQTMKFSTPFKDHASFFVENDYTSPSGSVWSPNGSNDERMSVNARRNLLSEQRSEYSSIDTSSFDSSYSTPKSFKASPPLNGRPIPKVLSSPPTRRVPSIGTPSFPRRLFLNEDCKANLEDLMKNELKLQDSISDTSFPDKSHSLIDSPTASLSIFNDSAAQDLFWNRPSTSSQTNYNAAVGSPARMNGTIADILKSSPSFDMIQSYNGTSASDLVNARSSDDLSVRPKTSLPFEMPAWSHGYDAPLAQHVFGDESAKFNFAFDAKQN